MILNKTPGLIGVFIIVFVFTALSCAADDLILTPSGLAYRDLEFGHGEIAEDGKIAVIHFTGWLDHNGTKGKQFIDSRERGKPLAFKIGTDRVMQGWNIGVVGMKPGGKRRLMIPAALAYGAEGVEDLVPPNAALIFDIELIEVK